MALCSCTARHDVIISSAAEAMELATTSRHSLCRDAGRLTAQAICAMEWLSEHQVDGYEAVIISAIAEERETLRLSWGEAAAQWWDEDSALAQDLEALI